MPESSKFVQSLLKTYSSDSLLTLNLYFKNYGILASLLLILVALSGSYNNNLTVKNYPPSFTTLFSTSILHNFRDSYY